jgi:hypothetical protein
MAAEMYWYDKFAWVERYTKSFLQKKWYNFFSLSSDLFLAISLLSASFLLRA